MSNLEIYYYSFGDFGSDPKGNGGTRCAACYAVAHHRGNETDQANSVLPNRSATRQPFDVR
jgi:hypothetical protein